MKVSKNFTLEEMYSSVTANKHKISNVPTADVQKTIIELVGKILQPVRDAYGKPIVVSSCYRCPQLNLLVGGATNSDHKFGAAADIHSLSNTKKDNKVLFDLIVKLANEGIIQCRQIIDEYNYKWVHVSINHKNNRQKKNQILHLK